MTKTEDRLRELEDFKAAEMASQVERDKAQRVRDEEQTRRYEELKKEIECLHAGMDDIKKMLTNGLSTATRENTDWRKAHQKEHEDAADETRKGWRGVLFGGINQVIQSAIGAAILLLGLWASGRIHITP